MTVNHVENKISGIAKYSTSFQGNSDFCVIGIMAMGMNSKLEEYYFHLLEKLEVALDTKVYCMGGARFGEQKIKDYSTFSGSIDAALRKFILSQIKKGLLTAPEARVSYQSHDTSALAFGLDNPTILEQTYRYFLQSGDNAAESVMLLNRVLEKLEEMKTKSANLSTTDWEASLYAAKDLVQLELLPYNFRQVIGKVLKTKKSKPLDWLEDFNETRIGLSLSPLAVDFITDLRKRMIVPISFYDSTIEKTLALAKNIEEAYKFHRKKLFFLREAGFVWYHLFDLLKQLEISYLVIEPPDLHQLNISVKNPNLDAEFFDFVSGKKMGFQGLYRYITTGLTDAFNDDGDVFDIDLPTSEGIENRNNHCTLDLFLDKKQEQPDIQNNLEQHKEAYGKLKDAHNLMKLAIKKTFDSKDLEIAEKSIRSAIELLEDDNVPSDNWCLAKANKILGIINLLNKQRGKAITCYKKALVLYDPFGIRSEEADLSYIIGILEKQENNYQEAKIFLQKSLEHYLIINNDERLAKAYSLTAEIAEIMGKDDTIAKENYLKAKDIYEKNKDDSKLIETYKNLVRISSQRESENELFTYLMELVRLDSNIRSIYLEGLGDTLRETLSKDEDEISKFTDKMNRIVKHKYWWLKKWEDLERD